MELWDIPVIDQHAHNILKPEAIARYPYPAAFTEAHAAEIINHHACHTLFYRRSLRDMATLLECEPEESEILARRNHLGLEKLTEICFNAAKIDTILLDDGFLPDEILPWQWHQKFVSVRRLLRIEMLAQNLIPQVNSFEEFWERFRAEIDPPPPEVVAFKSIVAYRTGLEVQPVSIEVVKSRFNAIKKTTVEKPPRLTDKSLIDFLVMQTLEVAAKHNMPVQFHTGFGDPDLDLRLGNPLHLRLVLEEKRFRNAQIVLLHASYPYTGEAAYLASVYPHVYVGFGLAIPSLNVAGMRYVIRQLLELAPTSKIMYSSDAHLIPDLYYLAGKWGRKVLGQVLEEAVIDGDLSMKEAEEVAEAMLRRNAGNIYKLSC